MGNAFVTCLAIDPLNSQTVYAGNDGLYKSSNGGTNWTIKTTGLTVECLAIDPTNSEIIYGGMYHHTDYYGIFKSSDSGESWDFIFKMIKNYNAKSLVISSTSNPATIFAGTEIGMYKTNIGSSTWTSITTGLGNKYIYSIAVNPTNPAVYYIGTGGYGAYKSIDTGMSWTQITTGMGNRNVFSLAVAPSSPNIVYAGTDQSVFKSSNYGTTWAAVSTGIEWKTIKGLIIDPTNPAIVYAGIEYGGVYKSTNGGLSWNTTGWNASGMQSNIVQCLAIDTINSYLYAGTEIGGPYSGIFKSGDGGITWTQQTEGLGMYRSVYSILVDPLNPQVIYIGAYGLGLCRSIDGGATWSQMNQGFPSLYNFYINALALTYSSYPILYCGTNSGVWEYTIRPTAVEPRFWQKLF